MPDYHFRDGSVPGAVGESRLDPQQQPPTLQPLNTNIDDDRLLKFLVALETDAVAHWDAKGPEGVNLKARRKQNVRYTFGKQLLGRDMKSYESEFLDNVIYEYESTLKSLATSKIPDIIVRAGGAEITEAKRMTAELLTKANENRMLGPEFRKSLGILFKHLPVYFIAAYKYRWDANKNKIGEIVEEVINPEHLVLDHTALSANPEEHQFIIQYVEKTANEWIMLHPKKEKEILEFVKKEFPNLAPDDKKDWLLAQKVKVAETWFDWLEKAEDFNDENPKFDFFSGLAWRMGKDLLLDQSKNPNWDYEGHDVATINGEPVDPEIISQMVATGIRPQGLQISKVFNNYFEAPRKPFIFMSFDQFLRSAIDETSRTEQNIPLQKSLDVVESQVDHMITHHKGKHIWGRRSGMTKKALKKLDMDNPNSDVIAKGDPNKVHKFIQAVMPPGEMFGHIVGRRERMFAKVGAHGATRGQVVSDVATTNQIAREADFTKNDDLVDETILHVTIEIAKARLHMMKLRYTPEHWKKLLGMEEGKYVELRLDNDSIDDGLEVIVTASTTDKLRAERNAQGLAELGFSDPISFMKDMGISSPEERTEMAFLWNSNQALYVQKFVQKKDISEIANQVVAQSLPQGQPPLQGQVQPPAPAQPALPSPQDTTAIPTQPAGSPRGLLGNLKSGINRLLGR